MRRNFPYHVKWAVKDSVFRSLFEDRRYALQLYQAIHPEDTDVTEADIEDVTINNVLTDQEYNDLGMMVRGKVLLMLECQARWSVNIIVRLLFYLIHTWNEYLEATNQNRHGSKRVQLPKPELYVLYIGERKNRPEWIRLSDEFFEGDRSYLDVNVRILYGDSIPEESGQKDIIRQYVDFTKVYNEQVEKYGRTREAVLETIRACKNQDVLREYLSDREKEVIDIMMALFDQEKIVKMYIEECVEERVEKLVEQRIYEQKEEARMEGKKEAAFNMKAAGLAEGMIAQFLGVGVEMIRQWFAGAAVKE